eukprot:Rhum_TRINITY_DN13486_c0_g1::Rhum_TRINITY_DN13486_c0_g1_i1::g.60593::m.60593
MGPDEDKDAGFGASRVASYGDEPKARFYSTLTAVDAKGGWTEYVLIGGWEMLDGAGECELECCSSSVVHVLDSRTWRWRAAATTGDGPPGVVHHAAWMDGGRVAVLGGCDEAGAETAERRMYWLDPATMVWSSAAAVTVQGEAAALQRVLPRASHTCVGDGRGGAYLFGGNDGGVAFGNLWHYDAGAKAFSHVTPAPGPAPEPRQYHAACLARGRLYLFGGAPDNKTTRESDIVYGDLWCFDPPTSRWTLESPPAPAAGKGAACAGPPRPRGSLSMHFAEPFVYVLGGFDGTRDFGDLRRFDVDLRAWSVVETPSWLHPRWGHCVAPLPPGHGGFLSFGGYSYEESVVFDDLVRVAAEPPTLKYLAAKFVVARGRDWRAKKARNTQQRALPQTSGGCEGKGCAVAAAAAAAVVGGAAEATAERVAEAAGGLLLSRKRSLSDRSRVSSESGAASVTPQRKRSGSAAQCTLSSFQVG